MATDEFKLKGLTSIDLKNGQTKEVEVEGVQASEDKLATVLLAKVKDEVHALSPKCTHYGAPLAKGVLTPDGRLTCPWHGACFNVKTGDIEDAPAPDPLQKFEIVQKDGGVYIKGSEADIKAARRNLSIKCKASGPDKVVVVGRGSGAMGAIEGLRAGGYKGHITSIAEEDHPPIDRTKLSKALMDTADKVQWRSPEFYKEGDVEFINDSVTSIDFKSKKVKGNKSETEYTKLILATGGIPNQLPLPGLKGDLKNVFLLRTLKDVQGILGAAGEDGGKKVVVIGSSFIGMEVGNALAGKKHNVSIVGMESEPCEAVFGKQVGNVFRKLLEKSGVKFYMQAEVEKGEESSSKSGSIGSVKLKDGTSLEADLVIEGVGVKPSTKYLQDSDIKLEKDGSVAVDSGFAVNGFKDVWAIGDIATYPYNGPGGNGKPVRIEHWNVAQNMGRSVAQSINSPGSKPKAFIPVFWSALGAQLRYCGHTANGYDDVIVQGNTDVSDGKQSFVAYYTKDDTVVAVASMMKDPYMTQSAELMRRGKMPSKSEITKGVDIMEVSVPAEVKI
ncbi:Putative FAD/NAD-linked reductase, dimerization domain superfamily, FAD/NAD(P)-binding protein [Septoria linicola]|uniref:FAD/NAD-linked reductase, dimerization domain superfamily, FAD/NAD(P)-binding protein n=1 Tax=Septoria linicola TaxID=215465 RepID=A0A9Q9AXL7_9PEZI|nr:Putative FAD/NAD-linked reductase, dimerization domain superfamily, FAD/NAD(P)-binding protein [Septoria linicola]